MKKYINDWYTREYPTDSLGKQINPFLTFDKLLKALNTKRRENIYKVIGVEDSIIRERIFTKIAEICNVEYKVIYKKWLNL